jgi:hypothetical protein
MFVIPIWLAGACLAQADGSVPPSIVQPPSDSSAALAAPWPGAQIDIADKYLRPLAKSKQASRAMIGAVGLGVGAVLLLHGAEIMEENEQFRDGNELSTVYLGGGAIVSLISLYKIFGKTIPEQEYARIAKIDNLQDRNAAAEKAIEKFAANARRSRLSTGVIFGVLGVSQLTILKDDDTKESRSTANLLAGLDFAVSAYCFLFESGEERARKLYKRDLNGSPALSLGPYFGRGTIGLATTISF